MSQHSTPEPQTSSPPPNPADWIRVDPPRNKTTLLPQMLHNQYRLYFRNKDDAGQSVDWSFQPAGGNTENCRAQRAKKCRYCCFSQLEDVDKDKTNYMTEYEAWDSSRPRGPEHYREKIFPAKTMKRENSNFDVNCPYCQALAQSKEDYFVGSGAMDVPSHGGVGEGPRAAEKTKGRRNSDFCNDVFGEKLGENQANERNKNWKLSRSNTRCVIELPHLSFEVKSNFKPHIREMASSEWKRLHGINGDYVDLSRRHADLGRECFVKFTGPVPSTHIWAEGASLHFEDLVHFTVSRN